MIHNICIFINALTVGGAEKQAFLLTNILKSEFNTSLVVLYGKKTEIKYHKLINEMGINYYPLKGFLPIKLFHLYRFLKKNQIDIILSYLATNNFYGAIIGKIVGIENIIGGIRNSKLQRRKFYFQRFTHNKLSKYTIFNNASGVDILASKGFIKEKCVVIPNGINVPVRLTVRENKKNTVIILTVGRFVKNKDFLTLIRSINYLIKNFEILSYQITLQIIGFGKLERKLHNWIRKFNLSSNIEVITKPNNIEEYYKNADIYISTSLFEGISNSILEAMSYNLPIVATDVGDNNHLIIDNYNGFLTSVSDYKEIAQKLYILITSYELRVKYGENSYYHCARNYSLESLKSNYIEFIKSL